MKEIYFTIDLSFAGFLIFGGIFLIGCLALLFVVLTIPKWIMEVKDIFSHTKTFKCKGCNCTVPITYQIKTKGYCYLCDPDIPLSELLDYNQVKSK